MPRRRSNSTTSVFDGDPAIAPRIAGTLANQTTTSEAPVHPFSGVTITDANSGATDVLTITVGGAGGALSGAGLWAGPTAFTRCREQPMPSPANSTR